MDREERIKARSKKIQQDKQMNNETAKTLTAAIIELQKYLKESVAVHKVPSKPSTGPVYNLYDNTNPFDLATRTGLSAYEASSLALDSKWDGSPESWPAFLISLRDRADECSWDATGSTGITNLINQGTVINVLENYHDVTEKMVEEAYKARKLHYVAQKSELDDKEFIFRYTAPNNDNERKLTIPLDHNDMFTFFTKDGYDRFFKRAAAYNSTWCMFAGHALQCHVIPDDNNNDNNDSAHATTENNTLTDEARVDLSHATQSEPIDRARELVRTVSLENINVSDNANTQESDATQGISNLDDALSTRRKPHDTDFEVDNNFHRNGHMVYNPDDDSVSDTQIFLFLFANCCY